MIKSLTEHNLLKTDMDNSTNNNKLEIFFGIPCTTGTTFFSEIRRKFGKYMDSKQKSGTVAGRKYG